MNFDISNLLGDWEYTPGQIGVRQFKGKDGSEKIQLRVDLGLLQMNAEGRPDGKRPYGHESLLEHFESKLSKYVEGHEGSSEGFHLTAEDCSRLQQEAIQYHHRYICLFQLQDYHGVIRDTERNLRVFEFVREHAQTQDNSWSLQQFRPQLLMMRVRARGALLLETEGFEKAIEIIQLGVEEIRAFFKQQGQPDLAEQSGEIQSLETWLSELESKRPLTKKQKLELALEEAVQKEDYEKAAKVRDSLRNLNTQD